ncbi:MAG: sulfotransferase family 2 domain-containing protein [Paracoccaceae bacterium]
MKLRIWHSSEPADPASPATRMFTTRRYPIFYLSIAKCGCTFLKNLFYALDHREQHPAGNAVHAHEADLVKARPADEEAIRRSPYAFTVLRDPVDRFLSFYFDKVYAGGQHSFPALRARLAERRGLDLSPGLSVAGHRENARILLDWVAEALRKRKTGNGHHHWKRQVTALRRVESLGLEILTLDGLDWQLPALLAPVIPDLAARMAAVTARNAAPRPVPQHAVPDATLRAAIDRVYARDRIAYDAASEEWAKRLAPPPPLIEKNEFGGDRIRVLTAFRYPLRCVLVPLSGSRFLRRLMFLLDNEDAGTGFPTPAGAEELVQRRLSAQDLRTGGMAFFVLRDPVERFFALYFEKVLGAGPNAFPWIGRTLARRGVFHTGHRLRTAQHRHNCRRLLGFLEQRFRTERTQDLNAFWRPQAFTARTARDFAMVPLLHDRLAPQLEQIAGAAVPGLPGLIARAQDGLDDGFPVSSDEIATGRMKQRINALYHEDRAIYDEARGVWDETGRPPNPERSWHVKRRVAASTAG